MQLKLEDWLAFSVTQSTESLTPSGFFLFSASWPVWRRFASKISKPEFVRSFSLILTSHH